MFCVPIRYKRPFPICFTKKVNAKIPKTDHVVTSYRGFKTFDETAFLVDLEHDLHNFEINQDTVDDDFGALHAIIINHLDKYAPLKHDGLNPAAFPLGILLK